MTTLLMTPLRRLALCALLVACQAVAQEPVPAVYKAHDVSFYYRSASDFYACHELQQRVAIILQAIGARDDIDVDVRDCQAFLGDRDMNMDRESVFGGSRMDPWERGDSRFPTFGRQDAEREQSARIRIRLMYPVEVTPQVLAEIEKDKSRRELVSRVTRNPAAAFNDPIVFAAQRQEVTLSRQLIRLKAEDCSLLDQMSTQVFRKLKVRVVRRRFDCRPSMASHIPPQMTVEALLPTGALMPMPAPESTSSAATSDDSTLQTEQPSSERPSE